MHEKMFRQGSAVIQSRSAGPLLLNTHCHRSEWNTSAWLQTDLVGFSVTQVALNTAVKGREERRGRSIAANVLKDELVFAAAADDRPSHRLPALPQLHK